jgi:hypothetical protein
MARLPSFPPSFRSPLTIVSKVAGAVLAADAAGAGGPFPILGKVSRVRGTLFFCHRLFLPPLSARHQANHLIKNPTKGHASGFLQMCCYSGGPIRHHRVHSRTWAHFSLGGAAAIFQRRARQSTKPICA